MRAPWLLGVLTLVVFGKVELGSVQRSEAFVEDSRCVGDCEATGEVTITNIIVLVNIALGDAPSSACAAGVPSGSAVDVSLIIRAINNALNGCTPPPTQSPTIQPPPTPTQTPGSPDVTGVWREDELKLISSNCNFVTGNVVAQVVSQVPAVCDTTFSQHGDQVHGVDCAGQTGDGTVDARGILVFTKAAQTQTLDNGCKLTVGQSLTFDASDSPTTAMYTLQLTFSGPCSPFSSCAAHLQSRFTKQ